MHRTVDMHTVGRIQNTGTRTGPLTAPAEEHGADGGNHRMGWYGRPEEGVRAVSGHPADIYRVWSARPEPGRGGLAPAPGGYRGPSEGSGPVAAPGQ